MSLLGIGTGLRCRMHAVCYGSPLPEPKTYVTCDSRVVPHRSTEQAQGCLTSEFGWDPVLSPWYERMMRTDGRIGTPTVPRPARHKPIEALAA